MGKITVELLILLGCAAPDKRVRHIPPQTLRQPRNIPPEIPTPSFCPPQRLYRFAEKTSEDTSVFFWICEEGSQRAIFDPWQRTHLNKAFKEMLARTGVRHATMYVGLMKETSSSPWQVTVILQGKSPDDVEGQRGQIEHGTAFSVLLSVFQTWTPKLLPVKIPKNSL